MKLKYYMRGLGIGILLATLILTIANRNTNISEAEIINKARELGMEFVQEEEPDNIEKILDNIEPSEKIQQDEEEDIDDEDIKEDDIDDEDIEEEDVDEDIEEEIDPTVTFTITRGMSSGKVSELLEDVGLIEDGTDFNNYIIGQGKASVIKIGTFTLSKDASYEQIIDAITS